MPLSINDLKKLEIPDFIQKNKNTYFNDNELKQTLFITGHSGSGKTTLIQNIAYKLKGMEVYYIDLLDTKRTHFIADKTEYIPLFLNKVSETKEIVIIDNAHHTKETRAIARSFLVESNKIGYPIIVSSQKFIHIEQKTVDIKVELLKDLKQKDIEEKISFLDLTEEIKLKSIIGSLLKYHNKTEKNTYEIDKYIKEKLYTEFSGNLAFTSIALKNSNSIKDLNKSSFEIFLLEEYKELVSMDRYQEFKLLLLCVSANDYRFTISKELYDKKLVFEKALISKLLPKDDNLNNNKSLLFEITEENSITLLFPHNTIPKYLIDLITREDHNIEQLIIENFEKIKIVDTYIYEGLFAYINNNRSVIKSPSLTIFLLYNNLLAQNLIEDQILTLKSLDLILTSIKIHSLKYQPTIIARKSNFTSILSENNILNNLNDSIELIRCYIDKEYSFVIEQIFQVLYKNCELLDLKLFAKTIKHFTFPMASFVKNEFESSMQKFLKKYIQNFNNKKLNNLKGIDDFIFYIFICDNHELDTFLKDKLYMILQYNKMKLSEVLSILSQLKYLYLNISKDSDTKLKLLETIDSIFYTYIVNKLNLEYEIDNQWYLNYDLTNYISNFSDKSLIYIVSYLIKHNKNNLLINIIKEYDDIQVNKLELFIKHKLDYEHLSLFIRIKKSCTFIKSSSDNQNHPPHILLKIFNDEW